jgi:MscS family membrane protein
MALDKIVVPWLPPLGIFFSFIVFCGLFHWIFLTLIRFLMHRLPVNADIDLAQAFDRPAKIIIFTCGLYVACSISPVNNITQLPFVAHLFHSIIVICCYWIAYNLCTSTNLMVSLLTSKYSWQVDETINSIIGTALHAVVICLGIATIVSVWGFDISGFIAGLSIGGLAFSLAAKDSLSNIFAGIVILVDRPFTVGDWIVCNDIEGTVESISFRSTNIRTFPQGLVYIPNSLLSTTAITNYTKRGKYRLAITLGVTYDTTKEQMEELVDKIKKYLLADPDIYDEDLCVTFDNMNSSSLDVRIVCFCRTTDSNVYFKTKEKINLALMGIMEEVGVSAAFPSTSVYIEKNAPVEK